MLTELKQIQGVLSDMMPIEILTPLTDLQEQVALSDENQLN
jgi:hypothetical protein